MLPFALLFWESGEIGLHKCKSAVNMVNVVDDYVWVNVGIFYVLLHIILSLSVRAPGCCRSKVCGSNPFLHVQGRRRRGGRGGTCLPTFKSGGGGTSGFVPPPPLLGRANVLISLFAHILWLKTQFFQNFLGSLRSPTLINQYFLNFANLNSRIIFHIFFFN